MSAWFWANREDAERWNGPEETRDAAIGEAIAESDPDAQIWVATGEETTMDSLSHGLDVDWAIERILTFGSDNGMIGEDTDVVVIDKEKAERELTEWAARNLKLDSGWWTIDGEKEQAR